MTRRLPKMAHLGGKLALSTQSVVGTSATRYEEQFVPGQEDLEEGEVRVTVLGSGFPFVNRVQASGSLLVEVGNSEKDVFIFDIGSGALANLATLGLPIESMNKLFLTHLHADHMGDVPALVGSYAKLGRTDPLEVWGAGSDNPDLGLGAFVSHMDAALKWDRSSLMGHRPTSGFDLVPHEGPFEHSGQVYDRNGVVVTSFPVLHGLSGAVGYRLEYAGRVVVFSGDTRPCKYLVEAAQGADLLVHECFQSPAVLASSMGLDLADATEMLKAQHTIPTQFGKILDLVHPRMAVVWHLDITEGVEQVLNEIEETYQSPVVVAQDLTVFNVTESAVVARQVVASHIPKAVHGPSQHSAVSESPVPEPSWFADAILDL